MTHAGREKVFVAMSGGVDSSVAAMLLKNQSYDVVGVFMKCWTGTAPFDKLRVNCAWERDSEDARRVAGKLGIPFYVWDFEEEYKKRVVEYMVEGYRQGLTPNPDVMCNKEIKFGLFLEKALALGGDYVATGHYVCLRQRDPNLRMHPNDTNKKIRGIRVNSDFSDRFMLIEAKDKNKDQSYFLWTLTQKQIKHCLFPIGDYLKSEVREIARKAGLPTADKKDSQGICFLGRVRLGDFLSEYIKPKIGQVRLAQSDGSYRVVGEHSGAHFYTIGQRHLGVNFQFSRLRQDFRLQQAFGGQVGGQASNNFQTREDRKPFYLAEKDTKTNTIVVAEGSDNPALYRKEVTLCDVNFLDRSYSNVLKNIRIRNNALQVLARVRYRQPLASAHLRLSPNNEFTANKRITKNLFANSNNIRYSLIFDIPQKFIAPGQSAVFYEMNPSTDSTNSPQAGSGLKMLGGGVIL